METEIVTILGSAGEQPSATNRKDGQMGGASMGFGLGPEQPSESPPFLCKHLDFLRSGLLKNSSNNRAEGTQNKNALITGKSYSERFKNRLHGKYTKNIREK